MSFNLGFRYGSTDHTKMRVRNLPVAASAAWLSGSLLVRNGSNEWAECGTDPAAIGGVALDRVGAGSGPLAPTGRFEFPPLEARAVLVSLDTEFVAPYTGTPALGNFGVTKGADGVWRVDFAKTAGTARVQVVDIEPVTQMPNVAPGVTGIGVVKCKVLAANVQSN